MNDLKVGISMEYPYCNVQPTGTLVIYNWFRIKYLMLTFIIFPDEVDEKMQIPCLLMSTVLIVNDC